MMSQEKKNEPSIVSSTKSLKYIDFKTRTNCYSVNEIEDGIIFSANGARSESTQHSSSTISQLNEKIKRNSKFKNRGGNCIHKNIPLISETFSPESNVKKYERISQIGEGTYGVVFKARNCNSDSKNEIVAMKRINVPYHKEEGISRILLREISLLKTIENYSHPNIVKLLDIYTPKTEFFYLHVYLIFEYLEQDLASYLKKCPTPGLCPDRIKEITYFILKGIDFLHSNRIVHRDLKPSNILVSKDGRIKIADFGLAKIYESSVNLTTTVVSLWYRSPEVLLCTSYASSIDIWSIGCIFAELFIREALISGNSELDQLRKIFQIIGSPERREWPLNCCIKYEFVSKFKQKPIEFLVPNICSQGKELIMKMLIFNPEERISAKDALTNNYFEEYTNHPPSAE